MSGDGTIRRPALLVLGVVSIAVAALGLLTGPQNRPAEHELLEAVPTTRQALRRWSASAVGVINAVLSHANWLSIRRCRRGGAGEWPWVSRGTDRTSISAGLHAAVSLEVDGLPGQGVEAFL
jgi:hypothetical protein